jgi:hypothetical protein
VKDAQKPDHVSLNALIGRMKDGRFVVPDFQREFEWEPWDILALMRSIFLDYYIGSLLLWRSTDEHLKDLSCEPLYGFQGAGKPEYIVLDGQQRLTAMYYAFVAPEEKLPRRKHRAHYYIRVDHFMAERYDDSFEYEWHRGDWPAVLASNEAQYDRHIFPLSVVGAGGWDLGNWVQGYEKHWAVKADQKQNAGEDAKAEILHAANAKTFGGHLREIVEQFQISYVELDKALSIDKVCDIFTQINSRGIRLDVFDLMNALLKPRGLQLKTMWREALPKLTFVETPRMNIYLLQTMSILRQAYCSPKYLYFLLPGAERPIRQGDGTLHKEVLVPDIADFQTRWNGAVAAFERTIKLLRHPQEYGVTASDYLPYVSILPVFAALQSLVDSLPAEQRLVGRRRLRHWYWASVFTNRYSGSVESTSARDFQDVRTWLRDDDAEPALIGEFKQRFNTLDLRGETKRGTSIYNAIFNLLVVQGARDWMTGDVPQPDDLDDHHIVPASWGAKNIPGSLVNSILNRTPLTSTTNRDVIRDRLPNVYLPELIAIAGRAEIERQMASHSVSPVALDILLRNPFTLADFEAFIQERQRTLMDAIESLLVHERLDLPPALRDLDQRIEHVELRLRALIAETAVNDSARLPSHVLLKMDERVQRELKKNPSLDAKHMKSLAGRLEYADLRELQDAIGGKDIWEGLAPRFGTKEGLGGRFNQLAELRNAIRHSRTTTPVIRKDGEAAILWFEGALKGEQA